MLPQTIITRTWLLPIRTWLLPILLVASAWASGPRYVTGPPFFTGPAGQPVMWKQANLLYFTDPGDLSAAVNHQAADALVAAAAGVWNIPVASITVGQGGELAEHVSGADVYLSTTGIVWPTDVESTNHAAISIAVVYDTDGSVTDTLLGAGASDPSGCEQNGVTESVDLFDPAGYILHAIVVLNGRCTGSAPELQLQLQYQLERVFGRVLGLAWSQTNDNVFTGSPTPTYDQALNWPIMHPIDILCGLYSFQCLPQAFMLRPDDIAGMVGLYPVAGSATPPAGKQKSLAEATSLNGFVNFPTGEGMAGVNVLVQQTPGFGTTPEGWFRTSYVTGSSFRRAADSPFVVADSSALDSMGTTAVLNQGYYLVPYVQVTTGGTQTDILSTEPVNPLYVGDWSVGAYAAGMVAPAGSPPTPFVGLGYGPGGPVSQSFTVGDAPATCGNGMDGTAGVPAAAPASGWWNGLLCGYGHASYASLAVKSGRSVTVEVTALDANGFATTTKAMPVIGLFAPTDGAGSLPSLGVEDSAFNGLGMGTTTLSAAPFLAGGAGGMLRVGIADQRGDGRPDFTYQARLLYADSIAPAAVATSGGAVTIAGMGFRAGNEVTINGVVAPVTTWSSTSIVLTAPAMGLVSAVAGTPVDVEVIDLGTGGTTTMSGALTYDAGALPNRMQVVTAPPATMSVGDTAPFTVQVVGSDGTTPVVGEAVVFSAAAGSVQFSACGVPCSVVTDAKGIASATLSPIAAAPVTVQAKDGALVETASLTVVAKASSMQVVTAPTGNVGVGQVAPGAFQVKVLAADGKTGVSGQLVTFSVSTGAASYGGCDASPCSVLTNATGVAQVSVTPTATGAVTLVATDGVLSQQATFTGVADPDVITFQTVPNAVIVVGSYSNLLKGTLMKSDGVTPVTNVPVVMSVATGMIFQTCNTNVCTADTQLNGQFGSWVNANVPGNYTITASYGSVVATTQVQVLPNTPTLTVVSAPSGTVAIGTMTAVPFSVKLLDARGNPMSGQQLNMGGNQGMVTASCGFGNCMLVTDGNGMATTTIVPVTAGTIVLNATWLGLNAAASFTAVGGVETMNVVTAPPANVVAGTKVSFGVQVLGTNGAPLPGVVLQMQIGSGSFTINGCSQSQCRGVTDANGTLTITGVGWVPGQVTLLASGLYGLQLSQQVSFTVWPAPALSGATTQFYLAAGATVGLQLDALAVQLGAPAAGVAVTWSAGSGFAVSAGSSMTDAAGDASMQASAGPLAAGSQADAMACAWTTACVQYVAYGVDASAWQIAIASGGLQAVTGGAATAQVVAQVTDASGHPVIGATVSVGQTVRAYVACPADGRCPAGAVLASGESTVISDANGLVSVTAMGVPGVATSTSLAFSTGTQGFATTQVTSTP